MYGALAKRLPHGWYAWHSLRLRDPDGIDAEADFLVADPARGILIIEVKGGRIEERNGMWYSNYKPIIPAPREQAHRFLRGLIELCRCRNVRLPACGIVTCFPDTAFDRGPTQADMAGCVLGAQDLRRLDRALQDLMEGALPRGYSPRGKWLDAIHALWGETWIPEVDLGLRSRLEEEERLRTDEQQYEILRGAMENESLMVTGGAGSGKTVLALALARELAGAGEKVLVLCFTEPLASWLQVQVGAPHPAVRAVKRYAVELLEQAGCPVAVVDSPEFWSDIAMRAAVEALPRLDPSWTAIIVDEAQDFAEDDWLLVEGLSRNKRLWAFWDPAQAFWSDRRVRTDLFRARLRLRKRYRCPEAVMLLAGCYIGEPADWQAIGGAIAEEVIAVRPCPGDGTVVERIGHEIDRLLASGLQRSDIAVLSLRGAAVPGSIVHSRTIGVHPLARAHDPAAGSNVVVETFLRFKGLERPGIIVTDIGLALDKADYGKRMYIALTRALSTARIVDTRTSLCRDPFIARLCP